MKIQKLVFNDNFEYAEYYPSNNDHSIKKTAFLLKDKKGIVYDGEGQNFVFGDGVSPFILDNCEDITLKNFSIDYRYAQHLEGEVYGVTERQFSLKFKDGFSAEIEDGKIKATSRENCSCHGVMFCQEFDPVRKAPYANTGFMYLNFVKAGEIYKGDNPWITDTILSKNENGDITFTLAEGFEGKFNVHNGGNLVFLLTDRSASAVFINNCKNIKLENITIYRSPSMGVIAQLSENVFLDNVKVVVKDGRDELLSSSADATHFVNCRGKVQLENCSFYNMLDDGCNIHGIYGKVASVDGAKVKITLEHGQQKGVNYLKTGDSVVFVSSVDYSETCTAKVKESSLSEDKRTILVEFEQVEGKMSVGNVVDNISAMPEVYINACSTGNNRPRGFLLTSVKPMIVENCLFENMACGIHVTSDARDWFESGKVTSLVIRNNVFKGCNYAWGTAAIVIDPSCEKDGAYVHKNIVIENNKCQTFGYGLLWAKGVDGLTVKNNEISKIYSPRVPEKNYPTFEITNCKNVSIS